MYILNRICVHGNSVVRYGLDVITTPNRVECEWLKFIEEIEQNMVECDLSLNS